MILRIKNILFWSIISAAFIGPGTVTVAAKAGASYGFSLLWALTFSIVATIVLQEGAARLTIATGKTLGEAMAEKFKGRIIAWLIFGSVVLGCAAYQAGNILGAVSGASLIFDVERKFLTLTIVIGSFLILRTHNIRLIGNLMGLVVAIMGGAFVLAALQTESSLIDIASAAITPSFPVGSSLLIIGLIGTTVVPYNLFLGSGISKGQQLSEMRSGLVGAVVIGGIISAAILVVGTGVTGEFSFLNLSKTLETNFGSWASWLIGVGLFAAGFTSSITAPLAAAVTGSSIFGKNEDWSEGNRFFKLTWMGILAVGLGFGLTEIKPIPVIILAQAVNGILLPLISVFLWLLLNDQRVIKKEFANGVLLNWLTGAVVFVAVFLGANNFVKAAISTLAPGQISAQNVELLLLVFSLIIVAIPVWKIIKQRKQN